MTMLRGERAVVRVVDIEAGTRSLSSEVGEERRIHVSPHKCAPYNAQFAKGRNRLEDGVECRSDNRSAQIQRPQVAECQKPVMHGVIELPIDRLQRVRDANGVGTMNSREVKHYSGSPACKRASRSPCERLP